MTYRFNTDRFQQSFKTCKGELTLRSLSEQIQSQTGVYISAATLSRCDNGGMPDTGTLCALCNYMGISPGDFFGGQSLLAEIVEIRERLDRLEKFAAVVNHQVWRIVSEGTTPKEEDK